MEGVKGTEIIVSLENKVGALAEAASILARESLNIRAVSGWVQEEKAMIRLVTSDNQKAKEVLASCSNLQESEVVIVEMANDVGQLENLSSRLKAAGVNMTHIYGTTSGEAQPATIVFASDDNDKALEAIK